MNATFIKGSTIRHICGGRGGGGLEFLLIFFTCARKLFLRACHTLAISVNDRVKGLSHLGDQRQRSRNAQKNQTLTFAGPSLCYCRVRLAIVADRR